MKKKNKLPNKLRPRNKCLVKLDCYGVEVIANIGKINNPYINPDSVNAKNDPLGKW